MTQHTIIKHSHSNKPTLYKNNNDKESVKLTRKALDIILKKYIIYMDESWRTISQGAQYFKIAEKFTTVDK